MIAVSGASGNLGRRTVKYLLERVDSGRVTALSRTPDPVDGVRARFADFAVPASLPAAFDGAERLLIISIGGNRPEHAQQQANAITAAAKAGVGHILYTSIVRAGEPGNPGMFAPYHRDTERALAESGVPFTVLRFNMWPEMWTYTGMAANAAATGKLITNAGKGKVGYLTRDDSAFVAAALLADGGHEGQILELTGSESIDDVTVAAALSEVSGRQVSLEELGDEEAIEAMKAQGIPEMLAEGWGSNGIRRRDGWFDVATHAVERISGRRPATLTEFFAGQPDLVGSPPR
jgi:NAD(P)H dehydrogenase (quinone)